MQNLNLKHILEIKIWQFNTILYVYITYTDHPNVFAPEYLYQSYDLALAVNGPTIGKNLPKLF